MGATKKKSVGTVSVVKMAKAKVRIIGETPLYFNAMSAKAKRSLFLGSKAKTEAEKAEMKHNPIEEFRESMYTGRDGPTLLEMPTVCMKRAMETTAKATPEKVHGTTVQRCVYVPNERMSIWGTPYLKIDAVRNSGKNGAPDFRTRAFLPNWCAEFEIGFVTPTFTPKAILTLIQNAGFVSGIGDFRQEKGAGSFGSFSIVATDEQEADYEALMSEGRDAQQASYDNPKLWGDDLTQSCFDMFLEDFEARNMGLVEAAE